MLPCFAPCVHNAGFIKDKCKMPIQNMTTCVTLEPRFGYNKDTKMCEEFLGCDDGGNSFPKAKQCWETCTSKSALVLSSNSVFVIKK